MSICIFHNGNRQILEFYKNKFIDLTFSGNLSETTNFSSPDCLWEICFADATHEVLVNATKAGIHILRHISTYTSDVENLLSECEIFDYDHWLEHTVIKYISYADEIISDLPTTKGVSEEVAIITTGRTANSHFQQVLLAFNIRSFENLKRWEPRINSANSAVLMWREDQWACLTSTWIAKNTAFIHNTNNQPKLNLSVPAISNEWIATEWFNMACIALDHAVYFKSVLNRPCSIMTTERAVSTYITIQKPLNYTKSEIIANYEQTKQSYASLEVKIILNLLYNKVQNQLPEWTEPV